MAVLVQHQASAAHQQLMQVVVVAVDTILQLLKLEEAAGQVAAVQVETELRQAQQLLAQQI